MRRETEAGGTCLLSSCSPHRAHEPVCGRGLAVAKDEAVAEPSLHLQVRVRFPGPKGQLTATYNSNSRGSNTHFWSIWALHSMC